MPAARAAEPHLGAQLLELGYIPIPILPSEKAPALAGWQRARLKASDFDRYPGHGVGIVCGRGPHPVMAVDIDVTDAELAVRGERLAEEMLGHTVVRVGKAPKVLLVFRAASEGWTKITGPWLTDLSGVNHRCEVLGAGQQFVAYGTHQTTGRPYEWTDLMGGLLSVRADELPVVTQRQLTDFVEAFTKLALAHGYVAKMPAREITQAFSVREPTDVFADNRPLLDFKLPDAAQALSWLDGGDYDTWVRVGMALHHQFEGSSEALDVWDTWSREFGNYVSRDDLAMRWDGFGRSVGGSPTTARWLIKTSNTERDKATARVNAQAEQAAREASVVSARDDTAKALQLIEGAVGTAELFNIVGPQLATLCTDGGAMKPIVVTKLRAKFKELSGTVLSLKEAEARLKPAVPKVEVTDGSETQAADMLKLGMTEFGNVNRFAESKKGQMMFADGIGWYEWDRQRWRPLADALVKQEIVGTLKSLETEADKIEWSMRPAFQKFALRSHSDHMVASVLNLSSTDPRFRVSANDVDAKPWLFGVNNGAVDLRSGALVETVPTDYVTMSSPVDFNPEAKCPLWEQTVADAFFGDTECVEFLQRLFGYAMLGQPVEQMVVMPYGVQGSNGKSTIFGVIRELFGTYACAVQAETFMAGASGNGSAAQPNILAMKGRRFIYCSEPETGARLNESLIKSLSGGDPLSARSLYSSTIVTFTMAGVVFMSTNHKPVIIGDDGGIWRRMCPIPFQRSYENDPDIPKDADRPLKLRAEYEGILAWCVRGALMYQRDGLKTPERVREARTAYRSDMDPLAEWLDAEIVFTSDAKAPVADVWQSWQRFMAVNGNVPFLNSRKALNRRLTTKGFGTQRDGKKGRFYIGLKLRDEATEDFVDLAG